jgi:hypothetical protein
MNETTKALRQVIDQLSGSDLALLGEMPTWVTEALGKRDSFMLGEALMPLILERYDDVRWDMETTLRVLTWFDDCYSEHITKVSDDPANNIGDKEEFYIDEMDYFRMGYSYVLSRHDRYLKIFDHADYPCTISASFLCIYQEDKVKWGKHEEEWFLRMYLPHSGQHHKNDPYVYIDKETVDVSAFCRKTRYLLSEKGFLNTGCHQPAQ